MGSKMKDELVVKLFKALAHPIRLRIVKTLLDGSKCVCELNKIVEFSQPNLSQHLKILKDAGILEAEKVGLNIHYRIKNDMVKELLNVAERFTTEMLKEFSQI